MEGSSCSLGKLLMILAHLGLVICSTQSDPESDKIQTEMSKKLNEAMEAVDKGLMFMGKNHHNINLDGVIGTRIVEGQIDVLLRHIKNKDSGIINELKLLRQKAAEVSNSALPYVIASQPEYYERIGAIIQEGFWTQDHRTVLLNPALVTKPLVIGEAMHEKDSDDCLTELLGTSGKTEQQCIVSRHCWKLMTSPGYQGYSLSHQVFYLLIAEATGCITQEMQSTINDLMGSYCANMMVQAKRMAKDNYPLDDQDLFMEIQALCGIAGYKEFITKEWLDKILNWQWKPQGCWGEKRFKGAFVKREERVLTDGCESHRTAVALGALVQYLRYLNE